MPVSPFLLLILPLLLVSTTSCRVVKGVFEAGAGFGAIAVVIVLALIGAIAMFVSRAAGTRSR